MVWLRSRWGRRAGWALVGLCSVWALAWLFLPRLIQSQLEQRASDALGRPVSVAAVHFRPWSLELTLEDLRVAGREAGEPTLRIARLYIDAELQSLFRLAPVVDALEIDGVQAHLTHLGQGHYDIDDILARLLDPARPDTPLPGFAVYNVAVRAMAVDFEDRPAGKTHEIRDLQLSLPFLSNLASKRQVLSEPRLSWRLNGSLFDSQAQTTPFDTSHKTDARLRLTGLDIEPYLPYWPQAVPVRPRAGRLEADLRLHFEQTPRPAVRLQGSLGWQGLQLSGPQGQALFSLDSLQLEGIDLRPLERQLQVAALTLQQPRVQLGREAGGELSLLKWLRQARGLAPATVSVPAPGQKRGAATASPEPPPSASSTASPATGWQVTLAKFSMQGGQLNWTDQAVQPEARLVVSELKLDAQGLSWPAQTPATFEGQLKLQAAATRATPAQLQFQGQASLSSAQASARLQGLALAWAQPYAAQFLVPALAGQLDAEVALQWKALAAGDPLAALQFSAPRLTLSQFTLGARGPDRRWPAQLERLQLQDVQVLPGQRQVTLGQVRLVGPALHVERDAQSRWMFESWLKAHDPAPASEPAPKPSFGASPKADPAAWQVLLKDGAVSHGQVQFVDLSGERPVRLGLSQLSLQLSNLATDRRQAAAVRLSSQVRASQGEPGRLDFQGGVSLSPLGVQGKLQAEDLPLHALSPYLDPLLNLRLLRADAGFRGQLSWAPSAAGTSLQLGGDALLEDVNAVTVPVRPTDGAATSESPLAEELFNWKALSLRGVQLAMAPGQALRVGVAETALSDFFARILIDEKGRINLQDLRKAPSPPAAGAVAAAQAAAPAPEIEMGPVGLVNGRVRFSDRFIKPNYSADLSALTGRLSAFSSRPAAPGAPPAMADLEVLGRAEGTAQLAIRGKLNPLAQPLALDITGQVRDLELPPLSAYSVKYAGHGIERGKLSMDVAYRVQPDGQLVASNKLVLNQLAFGEPVEGAPNSLPVRLAVALLADRDGVIDINLPISGSLNDPEFRLGPIIWKVVVNLVVKAVTSPFALLSSMFSGGSEELASVAFAPGSSELSPQARTNLDKVAQAMAERPRLRLTVAGQASLEAERDGWRRTQLNAQLQAEKRRAAVVAGTAAESVAPFTEAERPALLQAVYRRAQIAKPRNLLGLTKSLPAAEMEALLLASFTVGIDQMRELAVARSVAVKDYLAARGLSVERLFLGAAKLVPADAAGTPRAELSLALP